MSVYGQFRNLDILRAVANKVTSPNDLFNLCQGNKLFHSERSTQLNRYMAKYPREDGAPWLHIACLKGWHILACNLMDAGADLFELAPNQTSALDCAIMVGEITIAKSMLERGMNAATHPSALQEALHWAVRAQSMDAIKLLVEYGVDINVHGESGWPPLQLLISNGADIKDIKWMLERGADPNARNDSKGRTALHTATGVDDVPTMRLLMEHGAKVEVADWEGRTSLHASSMLRHLAAMQFLIDNGADIEAQEHDHRRRAIHHAALGGDVDTVKALVAGGADVEAQQDGGRRALHHALVQGHEDIVRFLIDAGADVNAQDDDGHTPIHLAANYGPLSVLELLTECGADLHAKHETGWSVLHFASSTGENDIVDRLLALELNVNERCLRGGTPLWVATRKGHASTVRLLLSRGADADISGGGQRGVDAWTTLFVASRNGNDAIVEILLEHGVDVNAVTHDGYTALAEAILQGHERVASFLMAYATR